MIHQRIIRGKPDMFRHIKGGLIGRAQKRGFSIQRNMVSPEQICRKKKAWFLDSSPSFTIIHTKFLGPSTSLISLIPKKFSIHRDLNRSEPKRNVGPLGTELDLAILSIQHHPCSRRSSIVMIHRLRPEEVLVCPGMILWMGAKSESTVDGW